MKRYIANLLSVLLFCSCSSQDSKIKEALENSIAEDLIKSYNFQEYMVLETILDINVKDSITQYKSEIITNEYRIHSDSARLKPILTNMEDCKLQKANTLYHLRSTYDILIRDYEIMHDNIMQEIQDKENENKMLKTKIKNLEDVLEALTSPIAFYKIKHIYYLNGIRKEDIVTLDSDYKFITLEQ